MARPPRERTCTRAGSALPALLRRIDPTRRLEAYQVWTFWDEVVGEQIARRAQPQRLRDGVLTVAVSSHSWMQELQFLRATICEKLNDRLGSPLISALVLVPGEVKRAKPIAKPTSPPVAIPDLPSTGDRELDAVFLRVASAHARRAATARAPRKRNARRR